MAHHLDIMFMAREFKPSVNFSESCKKKNFVQIVSVNDKPSNDTWSYPITELDYLIEQVENGERDKGDIFYLHEGRLYESSETKTC